ncbi:MAG: sigma 54-interacting transcriptional regulator [Desulfurivibrionaceae bacterium]
MPYLIVEKANKNHKIFRFSSEIKIGRGGDNDIILCDHDDSSISRNHMYIRAKRGGGYVLLDTSSNGTYIKGKPVKECFLADGLKFTINDYSFTFIDSSAGRDQKEPNASKKRVKKVEALYRDDDKTICTSTSHQSLEEKFKLKRELLEAGIIVENETMLTVFMDLKEISKINVPVLLAGEPGTGKEIVSRTLHDLSENDGDFVPFNGSAFPEVFFERELFGSGNGESQNARNKPGKLELAGNGTLFLDEIGDMSLALQARLLRFMEDRKVTRPGDTKQREISLRLVSATNRDLMTMMENGEFLGDLYQRLACITLNIPPLRERKEDIIPLANFFLGQYAKKYKAGVKKLSADAERMLIAAEWPDNVSELKRVLRNAVLRSNGSVLSAADLPLTSEEIGSETMRINPDQVWSMEEMEKRQIVKALEQSNGVKLKAAKILGISRDTLYKKIKKYRI